MVDKKYILLFLLLAPYALLALVYFGMGFLEPNYMVNEVHISQPYNLERQLFGIVTADGIKTPSEWFAVHHSIGVDLLCGLFYMLWIPLPIFFSLCLFFSGREESAIRLTMALFLTKLVGYVGYYIYPAAPPWYVMEHGFEFIKDTPGSAAGLLRVDDYLGIPIFHTMYTANANVFAAIPSLHSSYYPVALWYALSTKGISRWWAALFLVFSLGVWFAAVYTGHHYIIDVILGVMCSAVGVMLASAIKTRTLRY